MEENNNQETQQTVQEQPVAQIQGSQQENTGQQPSRVEPPKKKSKKGLVIIIIIIILIALGAMSYNCYNKYYVKKEKTTKKETKKDTKKETQQETKQDEIEKELDLTKSLNTSSDYIYTNPVLLTNNDENTGLKIEVNADKKTATLTINWNKFGPLSGASMWSEEILTYQVKGFSGNIKEAYIGTIGQDANGLKLFFIMEDKTIEYLNMFEHVTDKMGNTYTEIPYVIETAESGQNPVTHFESKGKVNGVEGITKLYGASVNIKNGSGYVTVLAKKAEGSFYDLGAIIK